MAVEEIWGMFPQGSIDAAQRARIGIGYGGIALDEPVLIPVWTKKNDVSGNWIGKNNASSSWSKKNDVSGAWVKKNDLSEYQ